MHLSRLIDRLTARFGSRGRSRPVLRESHVPERAEGCGKRHCGCTEIAPAALTRTRPIRLLDHPEEMRVLYAVPEGPPVQFIWRGRPIASPAMQGPERIAPEWWQDRPGTRLRDYFKVEDQHGRRFWLYREGLHDDGRGGDPRWFRARDVRLMPENDNHRPGAA